MPFPSSWISQTVAAQNSMFMGMSQFSQMASMNSGLGGAPQMSQMTPPPPPPTLGGMMGGYGGYAGGPTAGAWGEHMAGHMFGGAQMGMGLAGAGMNALGVAGSLGVIGGGLGRAASMMDPMGLAMRAGAGAYGMAGGGLGGIAAGGMAMGAAALPMYAAAQWAGGLAHNFQGGMQDQMGMNSMLRQNFNFQGGQGAFGRGFSQQQMGQIGGMVGQEARSNVFTSAGELSQLIGQGAQTGQFTGVRDVQEFGRRFREMITTLRTVQRELGGSLTEAQEFVNQSRQAGIFGGTSATRFAGTIRTVSAATGFDQGQLIQLAANGASIARAVGGRGEQGATGALRGISTVSAALQGGMISEAMLSEATGGRTGSDAMQSFVTDMMQQSGRFSRTAAGRYSIFGLSNRSGTGLDQGALLDFASGDMGAGDLSRRAHHRVGQMGRAQAINREGLLRGALMEEGGMAGQLGMMRMMVGDRAMDQGDDTMSLVMQRRLHMSRPQAEIMTSLMRNQSSIAAREAQDAVGSTREAQLRSDVQEHRSFDAFARNLEHEVGDATGMLRARDMGRSFVTRLSSLTERVMNDIFGIASDQMSTGGQAAMGRMRQGRASAADLAQLGMGHGGFVGGASSFNVDQQGLFETGPSIGSRLRARGTDTSGISTYGGAASALQRAQMADMGVVSGRDVGLLSGMGRDVAGTSSRILEARLAAQGSGNPDDVFNFMGGSGNATAAFMAQHGIHNDARADSMGRMMGRGGGTITAGMIGRDALRLGANVLTLGAFSGGAAAAGMDYGRSELFAAMREPQADSLDFMARGGHLAERLSAESGAGGMGRGRLSDFGMRRSGSAAMAAAQYATISGVGREDLQSLQGNEEFMSRIRAATGAGNETERRAAMERLTAYTNSQQGGTAEFAAMGSVVGQMQEGLRRHGAFGSEVTSFSRGSDAERAAAQRQVMEYGSSMNQLGERAGGRLGAQYRSLGRAAMTGNSDEFMLRQREMRSTVLGMSDEEYRASANRMMDVSAVGEEDRDRARAEARAAVLGMSHTRAIDRDLRGEGRRRGRGATETAIGEMTGYQTGSMEFEIGGRSVSGQRAQSLLQGALSGTLRSHGGRDRIDILRQFREQAEDPEGMGLSASQSREMMGILGSSMEHRDHRTGAFTAADRERMAAFTSREDIVQARQEAQERQTAQALSAAQQRDPVGAETNRLLTEINRGIGRIAPTDPADPPNMSTP